METIRELYRIGYGPSSSHTMGPRHAAELFLAQHKDAASFRVTLYGSLAATGKGHLTDQAIRETLGRDRTAISWNPETKLPAHPNAMKIEALNSQSQITGETIVYSTGGGAIRFEGQTRNSPSPYPIAKMDNILQWSETYGKTLWQYVVESEGESLRDHLRDVWNTMQEAISRGLENEGSLPGELHLARKAYSYSMKSKNFAGELKKYSFVFAFALAVSEENAAGGKVVTAPTCGSCGILPAVLKCLQEMYGFTDQRIHNALATAGLIGNLIKFNGSISGAEVGCAGEVGAACAMAAGAAAQLLGGSPPQIEYAAEMGLEHHLGLTCDPILGLVQIPCIERNAMAAARALECATYAILSDGKHRISFDNIVDTMTFTGRDISSSYRETSEAGLAKTFKG